MQTKLSEAIREQNLNRVQKLIEQGANVNERIFFANSPIIILASMVGNPLIIQELIRAKANVHAKDNKGNNALMVAAEKGYLNIVKLLINAGALINHVNIFGATALMLAAKGAHSSIIEILIHSGANINLNDLSMSEITHDLILYGNNIHFLAEDFRSSTALKNAAHEGHLEIVQMFLNAGVTLEGADHRVYEALQRLQKIRDNKIIFLKEIRNHFLLFQKKITHDLIDNIISFERMNQLILTKAERHAIYCFIELADSLAKKINPTLLKNLSHHCMLATDCLPDKPLLERMTRLIRLLDSKALHEVQIPILAELVQINGAILHSIPSQLKQDSHFFRKILGIVHCDRNDEFRRHYIQSFMIKKTFIPGITLMAGLLLFNHMLDVSSSKSPSFIIGCVAVLIGGLYAINKPPTATQRFFENRRSIHLSSEKKHIELSTTLR